MAIPNKTFSKFRDVVLRYDNDLTYTQRLIRIRLTVQRDLETIPTYITPLYEARFINQNPFSIPARNFEPRKITICIRIGDIEVTRTVFIPYRPTDVNHKNQILEYRNIDNIYALEYIGENWNNSYEEIIR